MKIGIIGAMDEELLPIRALSHHLEKIQKGNRLFWHGDMHGHQVYLTRCDPGKANAIIAAQQLMDFFTPDCLFNMGSSGALSPDLEVGDLVIATEAIQHDFDLTGWGLKPGEIIFDVHTAEDTGQIVFDSKQTFPTDEKYSKLAFEMAQSLEFKVVGSHAPKVFSGRIISGDQFISSVEKAGQLWGTYQALCVDMEAAAIAHACNINGIPFLCVRAMSDKADHSANVSFTDFLVSATENYGILFDKVIRQIGR